MFRIRTLVAVIAVIVATQAAFAAAPRFEPRIACCCSGAMSCACKVQIPAAGSGEGCAQCGPSESRTPASEAAESQRSVSRTDSPSQSVIVEQVVAPTNPVVSMLARGASPLSSRKRLARISLLRI